MEIVDKLSKILCFFLLLVSSRLDLGWKTQFSNNIANLPNGKLLSFHCSFNKNIFYFPSFCKRRGREEILKERKALLFKNRKWERKSAEKKNFRWSRFRKWKNFLRRRKVQNNKSKWFFKRKFIHRLKLIKRSKSFWVWEVRRK